MSALKPRIRIHADGTVSRRVATHDGWMWVRGSQFVPPEHADGHQAFGRARHISNTGAENEVSIDATGRLPETNPSAASGEPTAQSDDPLACHSNSGDGLNQLGGDVAVEDALLGRFLPNDLPAPDRSEAGLSGGDAGGNGAFPECVSGLRIPDFLRRSDGRSLDSLFSHYRARSSVLPSSAIKHEELAGCGQNHGSAG